MPLIAEHDINPHKFDNHCHQVPMGTPHMAGSKFNTVATDKFNFYVYV